MPTNEIEIIEKSNYGKISRYKTASRDPIKEAINHINNKYFQNPVIRVEVNGPSNDEIDELFPALGRNSFQV